MAGDFGGIAERPTVTGSYLAGRYARQQGDDLEAARYFRNALDQGSSARVGGVYLRSLILAGRIEEAIDVSFNEKLYENVPLAVLLRATSRIKEKKFGAAESEISNLKEGRFSVFTSLLKGWSQTGKTLASPPAVITAPTIGSVLPEKAKSSSLYEYHLALILDLMGFSNEAGKYYDQFAANPGKISARIAEALTNYYLRTGQRNKAIAFTLARGGGKEGDLDLPSVTPPRIVGNAQDGAAEAFFTVGLALLSAPQTAEEAMISLRLALYLRPNLPFAAVALGELYEKMDRFDEAENTYRMVEKSSSWYLQSRIRSAMLREKTQGLGNALTLFDQIAKEFPKNPDPLLYKADLLRRKERYREGAENYTRALERIAKPGPQHWSVFFSRGICYERSGNWEKAQEDLLKSLALRPDTPDVLNYLAYTWLTRNENLDKARAMLEKARNLEPDNGAIVDSYGWALFKLGDYDAAIHHLERAANMIPHDPTVREHLGDVYWKTGRKREARYEWQRALALEPEEKGAAENIQKKLREGL